MSGVRVELRGDVNEHHSVIFPNGASFVVLDDDTVILSDADGDQVAAVHHDAWAYIWIEEAAS